MEHHPKRAAFVAEDNPDLKIMAFHIEFEGHIISKHLSETCTQRCLENFFKR